MLLLSFEKCKEQERQSKEVTPSVFTGDSVNKDIARELYEEEELELVI